MEMQVIGGKIAKARKEINISQAQLAQLLFISPQAVGKWERGESVPDIVTFSRLAEVLGVDLNYFSDNPHSSTTAVAYPIVERPAEQPAKVSENKLNWDMSRGNWLDADFSGLKGLREKFSSSNMLRCKFIGSDMSGLLLKGNNVDSCDFSGSDFSNSQLRNSYLSGNVFKNCSLKDAGSSGTYITGCDLSGADLTGMVIRTGGLEKCAVADTHWERTSFNDTRLADMIFNGTMKDCYFENCAFSKVTFENAIIINTFFKNKSLKKISFINCQADRMTYEFLKNGKADLSGITLVAS